MISEGMDSMLIKTTNETYKKIARTYKSIGKNKYYSMKYINH
jgi:hypothetical protein